MNHECPEVKGDPNGCLDDMDRTFTYTCSIDYADFLPDSSFMKAKRQDFFNSWGTTDSLQQLMGKEVRLRQSDCGQLRLHVGDEVTFYCILVGDNPLLGIERHRGKKPMGMHRFLDVKLLALRPILEGKVAELRWGLSAYLQILMERWGKEGKHEWILLIKTFFQWSCLCLWSWLHVAITFGRSTSRSASTLMGCISMEIPRALSTSEPVTCRVIFSLIHCDPGRISFNDSQHLERTTWP